MELDPINWVIVHKKGNQHKNTDALSRHPVTPDLEDIEKVVEVVQDVNVVSAEQTNTDMSSLAKTAEVTEKGTVDNSSVRVDNVMGLSELACDAADIGAMQLNYPDIDTVRHWVEHSQRSTRRQLRSTSQSLHRYLRRTEFSCLSIINGLLCCSLSSPLTGDPAAQVVVPPALKHDILFSFKGPGLFSP